MVPQGIQILLFKNIFLMWTIFKVSVACYNITFVLSFSFLATIMWDPSSLTRDQTCTLCI